MAPIGALSSALVGCSDYCTCYTTKQTSMNKGIVLLGLHQIVSRGARGIRCSRGARGCSSGASGARHGIVFTI